MDNIERSMVNAFKIEKYQGTTEEKLALRDLATQMSMATDINFGAPEESANNFKVIFNELLGLSPEDLEKGMLPAIERLFMKRVNAVMDYSSARLWYESNKETFDAAYSAVLDYMKLTHPEMLPETRGI